MDPICAWAVFAESHSRENQKLTLQNVFTEITITGDIPDLPPQYPPDTQRIVRREMTLYVFIIAGEGEHILSFTYQGAGGLASTRFEIKPEHNNGYLVAINSDFPMGVDEPTLNVFPLLLDGEPLARAHLLSVPAP